MKLGTLFQLGVLLALLSPATEVAAQSDIAPRKWSDVADAGFASVNDMDQNGIIGGAGGKTVKIGRAHV